MQFRFGDGGILNSKKKVLIPIFICEKEIILASYVVDGELPLLFSRESLKQHNIELSILNDEISIDGKTQNLIVTQTGHYVVDIIQRKCSSTFVCYKNSKDTAIRLHRYYGHPKSKRLLKLIEGTEYEQKDLITEIKKLDDNCEECKIHKREPSRPKSSLLTTTDFNQVVAMDLKQLSTGQWILHLIDIFSRFSATKIIPNKKKETIVAAIFTIWIVIFGTSTIFLTDNGGEFVNELFVQTCEELGIIVKTTAAYAPFSNGICERHNGLIAETFDKIIKDISNPEIALAWATNVKNSLCNSFGYSPYTLVFGRNPNLPGLDNIELITSMNGNDSIVPKILADQLNCMKISRKAFTEAVHSDKLRRALKDRIPKSADERYYPGDIVYFKKLNQRRWCGPATVIGVDGKVAFLRQGGFLIRVHTSKLLLKNRADEHINSCGLDGDFATLKEIVPKPMNKERVKTPHGNPDTDHDSSDDSHDSSDESDNESFYSSRDNTEVEELPDLEPETVPIEDTAATEAMTDEIINEQDFMTSDKNVTESNDEAGQIDNDMSSDEDETWENITFNKNGCVNVKCSDKIRYKVNTEDEFTEGIISSRAGKSTGKDKNQYNIVINENDMVHVHLDKVIAERCTTETEVSSTFYIDNDVNKIYSVTVPKSRYQEPKILEAMNAELKYWKDYGVYSEVRENGQKVLSTRWVITPKGDKFKARLVVRGFEDEADTINDSPTGEKSSVRIILSISNAHNWKMESIDIKGAFLQANKLSRDVFVRPPREIKKLGLIWKLEKPAYGLADSSRQWYNSLTNFLISIGCEMSKWDKALFYFRVNNKLCGMLLFHVDDFIMAGSTKFKELVVKKIKEKYDISKHVSQMFKFIGVNITQENGMIILDQFEYAKSITAIQIDRSGRMDKDRDLTPTETTAYRSLLGKLQWISGISRPDIKFDVFMCSRVGKTPKLSNLLELNKIVSRLLVEKYITYPKLDLKSKLRILVYCDASFKNLDSKVNSGRGYIIFLSSVSNVCCLAWTAGKTNTVCTSVLASESIAMKDAVNHAIWLRAIVVEAIFGKDSEQVLIDIVVFTDSNQLYTNLYSTKYVADHALRLTTEALKEKINQGIITEVRHVNSEDQLADCFTKSSVNSYKLDNVLMTGEHLVV